MIKKYDSYHLMDDKDGYEWAMEMAGAKVMAYKSFGSYQGDWFAKVEYKDKTYWIKGGYGSCPGCDAWNAECDYKEKTLKQWKTFCTKFAKPYLNDPLTFEEVMKHATENLDWDTEAIEIVKWLNKNK